MESDKLPCCELGSRAVLAKGAVAAVPEAGQWLLLVECQGWQEELYRAAAAAGGILVSLLWGAGQVQGCKCAGYPLTWGRCHF